MSDWRCKYDSAGVGHCSEFCPQYLEAGSCRLLRDTKIGTICPIWAYDLVDKWNYRVDAIQEKLSRVETSALPLGIRVIFETILTWIEDDTWPGEEHD